MDVTGADPTEMLALCRSLLDGWKAATAGTFTSRRRVDAVKVGVVHGLCAHAHMVAEPAVDLLEQGRVLAAMPLIRATYEAGITAQWSSQTEDGVLALLNEDQRQRRALARNLETAVSRAFRESAPSIGRLDMEALETSASARYFEGICADLEPEGSDAYVVYRAMSQLSHASALVVDQYVEGLTEPPYMRLRLHPTQPNGMPWLYMTTASLIWAGRAVDFLDQEHRRRAELRNAARDLGIRSDLQLTHAARERQRRRRA